MAILTAGLLASGAFVIAGRRGLSADASVCGPGGRVLEGLPGPVACVHEDEPPAGVDVTERVRTRELTEREGASAMAYDAAEDLGVPSTPAANASSPAVKCDGDGTSEWQELQAPMPGEGPSRSTCRRAPPRDGYRRHGYQLRDIADVADTVAR